MKYLYFKYFCLSVHILFYQLIQRLQQHKSYYKMNRFHPLTQIDKLKYSLFGLAYLEKIWVLLQSERG